MERASQEKGVAADQDYRAHVAIMTSTRTQELSSVYQEGKKLIDRSQPSDEHPKFLLVNVGDGQTLETIIPRRKW